MRKHARQELGISEAKEEGSLMRTYLEQRIPIGDHRTMAQIGFMMAWGWEAASTTDNLQMQAFCGKMLSYVEQACLDGGRTGLADGIAGAELPRNVSHSEADISYPLLQTGSTDLGGGKRQLLEGHRHFRDKAEDLGHPQQSYTTQRQGSRKSHCSSEVEQEEEGRKRRRRCHRRSVQCMTNSISWGSPEQRSESCKSNVGKIVVEEPVLKPVKDFALNSFSSYLNNIQPDKALDAFSLIEECLLHLERIPCSFNTFKSKSLRPCWLSRTVEGSATPRQPLWPIPPPLWGRWKGCNSPGPRKRRRLKQLEVQTKLLQHVVCMLNWIILGYPDRPNQQAHAGEPVSSEQYKVLETLECHISHFCRLPSFARTDLGRFGEKFDALFRASQELPASVEVDLDVLLHEISNSFDSYAKYEAPHFADRSTTSDEQVPHNLSPDDVKLPNMSNKPVIASRIKWKNPPSFDPRPYLVDPVVAAVFDEPDVLRPPQNQWPTKRKARVHCSRPELLKLVKIWDAYGSLALIPCEDVPKDETVGIFAVPKDHQFDRLIINPTVINSRMAGYSHYTKKLAPGALISLLSLEPHQALRYNADDLSDFYYTFRVSPARAKRNAIGVPLYRSEVDELACFPKGAPGPFYPALATLAMGDNHAVEIAQCSHHSLLQIEAGCMNDCETLEYRKPVPRSDFIEMLAIDDHIGLQKVNIKDLPFKLPDRDTRVFDQSNKAYSKVGLVSHPGKQRRFETEGVLLGADLDGIAGRVSAPRSRILMLILVTSIVCRKGTCTRQMLSSILGCWIHVVLFRRPLLALIDALFKEGLHLKDTKTFRLSSQARHELMSLCILGTCAQADLRVGFCPRIYALDASPWGGGIVVSEATSSATAELWHSEQRGYHTNLLGQAASCLKELGFDSAGEADQGFDDFRDHVPDQSQLRVPASLREGFIYDCVELFRGSGNWSKAHESHGFSVHDGFDNSGSRLFFRDLSDNNTFRTVVALALRGVVREFHAGPPCLTFGTLRRPRLRSIQFPAGFDMTDPLTASHNLLARRTAMIGCLAIFSGAYFSCEQTGSSVMFRMHCFQVLVMMGCVVTRMAFCNFGSGFNKPSQWLHNKSWLLDFEGPCRCKWKGKHFTIQGSFTRESIEQFRHRCIPDACTVYGRDPKAGETVASYSAQYPVSLMHRMAQGSRSAQLHGAAVIPISARSLSYQRVGLSGEPLVPDLAHVDDFSEPRAWYEDPEWISEIADSLPFRTLFKYHFKESNHINVLETRVYSSWIKYCAKQHRNSRVVGLLDSRVALGAASKGRSSSYAISRILKRTLPYLLGSNLYPGGLHVYSSKNRADAPSRDREVEEPSKAKPQWLLELLDGKPHLFDLVCQSAQVPKLPARWLRMLLMLCGDIEPHPGPGRKPRGELDMTIGFHKQTSLRMQRCLEAFAEWVREEMNLDFDKVASSAEHIALALRAYGLHLFRHGHPRYMLVYALTAVQDTFPQHRPFLGGAWQVNKKWEVAEPGECRPVVSLRVFRAAITVGILWQWFQWVGITLLAFAGMLHPSEFVGLERRHLMFPRDTFYTTSALYIHLKNPKTSRFARQQHVKISDPEVIQYVDYHFGALSLSERIYNASISAYRNQWTAIMTKLGVPCKLQNKGVTPGSLRGSGATQLYLQTENIPLICWRGRWARVKTLEFYLQEVSAQVLLHSLSSASRSLIGQLNRASFGVFPKAAAKGSFEKSVAIKDCHQSSAEVMAVFKDCNQTLPKVLLE